MTKLKILLLAATAAAGLAWAAPAPAQTFESRTIRVSNGVTEDHPNGAAVRALAQCAAARTDNRMRIQGFWGGALGGDLQATQALRAGTQEMVVTSSSPLVGMLPALGVFDLPFLFANEQEADAILDGDFGADMGRRLEGIGLVNLTYWENGFRNTSNSRRAITKWEDFNGVRMRVMQNNIFLDTFRNMGSNAIPMAFGEVFTALETRAIDGQENPLVTIETSRFSEVQRYLSLTRHAYTPFLVLYSKALWDRLSPAEQTVLRECSVEARDVQRRANRQGNDASLTSLRRAGMQVNELSPAEQTRMREQARVVWNRHADQIGRDVVDRMIAELDKLRAGRPGG
ncbi:TRAP transporter substrate-binding protein [Falsiroseomonas sp. HW251]|uniref:TRAP transporter substrate-binding protein n=1 Tax=Falsiroseomonas sp. HW251 TaxID=3390998 RepID=UPI003D3153D1